MAELDFQRPDPDTLLRKAQAEERQAHRGRLKIFFGGCAGTGKTYAMLSAAHERLKEGVDVMAGVIETHGRTETAQKLMGIPQLPRSVIRHKGIALEEFDIDAALARKPAIILMDEFAHTNAPGTRHPKRWQDVEELLNAGIDVYTTLNVQHVESLSDVVTGVTGIRVKETIPDAVFDAADDIVLVDITADELLKRLREGKVYVAAHAKDRAAEHFFKKNNIIALRELALRRTTERVDAQMDDYNAQEGIRAPAPVADKVIVCIGPDALSPRLIRTAKRMAGSLKASWTAVYVETGRHYRLSEEGKNTVEALLRMAERIGGKTRVLQADNAADAILAYAREHGVTKIILGKALKPRWKDMLYGSLVDRIVRKSSQADIYVVTGSTPSPALKGNIGLSRVRPLFYAGACGIVGLCTCFGVAARMLLAPIDQALVYLIGNVIVAARLGRGPSVAYALLSAACFNFFFIPPLYTLQIYDRSYWMTLAVMLVTSLVITSYASRLRLQLMLSHQREQQTRTLYDLTRGLASTRGQENLAGLASRQVEELVAAPVTVWMQDAHQALKAVTGHLPERDFVKEMAVLQWCFDHKRAAGRGTETMPSALGLYLPLLSAGRNWGVIGLLLPPAKMITLEEMLLLETVASLFASALERANAAELAEQATVEIEREKLRNMLLSAVSHDLRTPIASITGAASGIVAGADRLSTDTVRDLASSIHQEADRLSRIVTNLLNVTRLESGGIKLQLQPYYAQELIGSALTHIEPMLARHRVVTESEPNLPMVEVDGLLVEQVLVNLLENAVKYSPSGSEIKIRALEAGSRVEIRVADQGPGIPAGDERRIFEKFYITQEGRLKKGTGLGLAICYGAIKAHGGEIWEKNRTSGGSEFFFTLPVAHEPPEASPHDA